MGVDSGFDAGNLGSGRIVGIGCGREGDCYGFRRMNGQLDGEAKGLMVVELDFGKDCLQRTELILARVVAIVVHGYYWSRGAYCML